MTRRRQAALAEHLDFTRLDQISRAAPTQQTRILCVTNWVPVVRHPHIQFRD